MKTKEFNVAEVMQGYRVPKSFSYSRPSSNNPKFTLKVSGKCMFEIASIYLSHTELNHIDARVYIGYNATIGAVGRIFSKSQLHLSSISMFTLKYGYINDALHIEFSGLRTYSSLDLTVLIGTAEEVSSVDTTNFKTLVFNQ